MKNSPTEMFCARQLIFGLVATCCLMLVLVSPSFAAVAQQDVLALKLAAPISDHMVLQHGKSTSVWGKAKPNTKVTVAFGSQSIDAETGVNGDWSVSLQPLEISAEPAELSVTSDAGENLSVKDILVGEVWMCSGQSNMAWTLKRTGDPAITEANFPKMRIFKTVSATAEKEKKDCQGDWKVVTPETAGEFSAVGYFFGREVHESINVPVGLVDTSWGGKPVEAFTSREKLDTVQMAGPLLEEWDELAANYDAEIAEENYKQAMEAWEKKCEKIREQTEAGTKPRLPRRPQLQGPPPLRSNFPAAIYNQKVAPWTRYAIAGSIWYQGESNSSRAVQYQSLLTALIEDWRAKWNDDFPFYIVQLANFQKPTTEPGVASDWAELQNAQTLVAQTVPGCGIAIVNEIGMANDIHPKNKKDVGHRLALLALKQHYKKEIDPWSSPLYSSHTISADQVTIKFDHVGAGLKPRDDGELKRFEIAGDDKKWQWANAKIESTDTVVVSSDLVPNPVAVRYAWASNPVGANLANSAGLPASIFRTDDWPLSTANRLTRTSPQEVVKRMGQQGFKPLFNGTDLKGWRNPYDYGNAKIVGGEIHLTANKKFFLVTEKKFADFELMVDVRLPSGQANSGVMFRCHVEPNRVFGYQAECDGSDRRWSAGLYDEGRRQWIWPSSEGRSEKKFLDYEAESKEFFAQPEIRNALKREGWNRYKITCRGDNLKIELNGVQVTDLRDDKDAEGYIGIQHHGETGQTYRFRNLFIKELN
jgi:sialate O-acetylesterase